MSRLRASYNRILRGLLGVKLWNAELERVESMTELFTTTGIKSFPDLFKFLSENCVRRIEESENSLIKCILNSDARVLSRQWVQWNELAMNNT